jgi:gamma-glutamylcyclotransferase (GGCT)/AIG2-like uncharacterized protein YtfP
MLRIFAYGTLREGFYNFSRFSSLKKIDTTRIKGFKLYSTCYGYPGVKEDSESSIVVDVLEANESDFNSINAMEKGAGYSIKEIEINGQKGVIYIYNLPVQKEIKNGDFKNYK